MVEEYGGIVEIVRDSIPVPSTAQVGQTIVVKEVDESGKPVSWECVDVPAGGDIESWNYEKTITIEEEVASITINTLDDGTPLALKKIELSAIVDSTETSIRSFKIFPDLLTYLNHGYISVGSGTASVASGKATLCRIEGEIADGVVSCKYGIATPNTRYTSYYNEPLIMKEDNIGLSYGSDGFKPYPNKATCFNTIVISTSAGNFKTGSTIIIKGVRA